jgi:predicted dehydrogenase
MPKLTRRRFLAAAASSSLSAAAWKRVYGANERVGVGFIGFGLIGKRHVLDFQQQQDVSLVALSEVHQGRLDEGLSLLGSAAKGYRDFRELLDDRNVNAVVISTPDHWHALQTMLACAAEKDVYVEKPLTLFVREGRWMIDIARRHRRIVQVGMQQRSGPHYQQARELIRAGHVGRIVSVRMNAMRNVMPGFGNPPDQPPPSELDWNMWLGPAPQRPYNPNRCLYHFRWFWDYSGGQMTNLGAHALDIVDWYLAPEGPQSVTSSGGRFALEDNGETPDTQDSIFDYSGFTALWSHRETATGAIKLPPLEFFGTKGSLAISRSGFTVTPDKKVEPQDQVPQFTDRQPVGGVERSASTRSEEFWTTKVEDKSGDTYQQLLNHVRNFVDCVKSRAAPIADLESAHRVATACHLANVSLRLGRKIRWDSVNEKILDDAEADQWLMRPYRAPWDKELQSLGVSN